MVESSNADVELQYLVSELKQRLSDDGYLAKCSNLIKERFDAKSWGGPELRKLEVMLEGALTDDVEIDNVSNLFGHLEDNPPSDRIKKACNENMHRAGGKLLDRSKYTPNSPLTSEMK